MTEPTAQAPGRAEEVLATREPDAASEPTPEPLVEEELLVEDVSIDGMCGVY
jgi:mycofactocin precursor